MSFRLVPKSVTYFAFFSSEFGYLPGALRKSSRSLSHLLMSSCYSVDYVMHPCFSSTVMGALEIPYWHWHCSKELLRLRFSIATWWKWRCCYRLYWRSHCCWHTVDLQWNAIRRRSNRCCWTGAKLSVKDTRYESIPTKTFVGPFFKKIYFVFICCSFILKAKFHYTLAGLKLVRSWFELKFGLSCSLLAAN